MFIEFKILAGLRFFRAFWGGTGVFLGTLMGMGLGGSPSLSAQGLIQQVWDEQYDGTTNGFHQALAVAMDADGNVVATGPSVSSSGFDFYTIKYRATDGVRLWDDRYDGTGDDDDVPVVVKIDGEGNVVVAGGSAGVFGSGLDLFVRKYKGSTGVTLWSERYNGPSSGDDAVLALALDAAGNVVVTGSSAETGAGLDLYTAKYSAANGARLWFRRYNGAAGEGDVGVGVAVDAAGAVVVAANSYASTPNIYLVKYAGTTNAILWDEEYKGPAGAGAVAAGVALDAGGNAFVVGTAENNGTSDIYVAKHDGSDGDEIWSKLDNGAGNGVDEGASVAVDAAGDVYVAGSTFNGTSMDLVVMKFAGADGRKLWSDRYDGPVQGADAATAVAVDLQGNVVVTGTSPGPGGDLDIYTAAYDGRTGKRLWSERYDGLRGRDDVTYNFGLALGPLNSVAVAGTTQMTAAPNAEYDFLTVAYAVPTPLTDADADGLPDSWETVFWGATAGHGPADDADNDGVSELVEYAFGMNPTAADADRVPTASLVDGFLTVTVAKRTGVTLMVETSGTLATNSWSAATTVVVTNTASLLTVRDAVPVSAGESRFLRVRVSAP